MLEYLTMVVLNTANPGKKIKRQTSQGIFWRYPIQTKLIEPGDDFAQILFDESRDFVQDGDLILVAESAIAAAQGRVFKFDEINYGFWAKLLSRFVSKSSHGIGLATPQTMQLAINEAGLLRILLAAFVHAVSRLFGVKGNFYRVAGEAVRGIDGPTDGTIEPYNKYASLIPKEPRKFAQSLEQKFLPKKIKVIVIDANDIGVNILGEKDKQLVKLAQELAKDNPLGQGSESTPALLCRSARIADTD